jgi:hypothetical protein
MKIQAETKEWVITEDGQLVQVAATKKHSKMKEDQVTDYLPNSYVFSNAKFMELHKGDFEDEIVDEKFPRYLEGNKPEIYKKITFAEKYFKADKETPAKIISNIRRAHPVITDEEQTFNPFIQRANDMNKEARQPAIETIMKVSEFIKPDTGDGSEIYPESEKNPQRFYYGGYTRNSIPKAFLGLDLLFDTISDSKNKKRYKKELANETDLVLKYGDRQKELLADQRNTGLLSVAADQALGSVKKDDLNLSSQKADATYQGDRYARRLAGDTEQSRNLALRTAATMGRYLGSNNMGAVGSMVAQGIDSANQIGFANNRAIADMDQRTAEFVSNMSRQEQEDALNNKYAYELAKNEKMSRGITDVSNIGTAYTSGLASFDPYVLTQMIKERERQRYEDAKNASYAKNARYVKGIKDTIGAAASVAKKAATMGMG